MDRLFLAMASRIIAFTLSLHLLAATGFAATGPLRHKHRRASAAHATAAAKLPVRAPVKRLVSVASRTRVRVTLVQVAATVQAQKAVAGLRLVRSEEHTSELQ